MAGLGCLQRGLGGLGVAQLADQDDVRILAEHAAERLLERLGVEPDLALVDDAAAIGMQDLDRVLDRDDVLLARAVDEVEHRRERGRLAGAGRAGDEHEPAVLAGEALHARRQAERLEARDLDRDDAERERDRAALAEAVDAEAPAVDGVRDVEVAARVEVGAAGRIAPRDDVEHALEVRIRERRDAVEGEEVAVVAKDRRLADLQVDVAGVQADRAAEERVQVHGCPHPIGRAPPRL